MRKQLLYIAVFTFTLVGCAEFEEPVKIQEATEDVENIEDQEIIGDNAESRSMTRSPEVSDGNPYSLDNVQEAYNDVAAELGLPPMTIDPTHYYVKFAVQDTLDYNILTDSLGLELIKFPLDRELTEAEIIDYLTDTLSNWYYTAVSTDFEYPFEVTYEFLDNIYMQAEDGVQTRSGEGPRWIMTHMNM